VTLVVEGAPVVEADLDSAAAEVLELVAAGTRLKPAVTTIAAETGLAKNVLYEVALKIQRQSAP
jgi:16S rRNA (cytidine1402-2'-O)-methyltransferase